MMDSLEGYLDNIASAATQTAENGGPLPELSASLDISVDTVARQHQEIKRLSEQINALKKKGTQVTSGDTLSVGTTIYAHCEAVGRTAPHRKNACYFDPQKMIDRKYWARKLMEEKGVKCEDNERWWGKVQTVVHKYPSKEPLMYEDSLSCSTNLTYMPTQYYKQ